MAKKAKKAKAKAKAKPARATSAPKTPAASPKKEFLEMFEREHATTMKLLRAFPADKLDLQPHPKSKTARNLAWNFVMEQAIAEKALTTGLDWSVPPQSPPAPETLDALIAALDQSHKKVASLVGGLKDGAFFETVKFPVAPKTIGDVPKIQFLWMLLCDQIHHRGQFSVYLRMADGKVPSIYGPSADEPWM